MIKIITVYNSLNPGSYFQALALYKSIQKEKKDVAFLYTNTRNPVKEAIKKALKLLKKKKIKHAYKQLVMGFKYKKSLKNIKTSRKIKADDIYILGSDEIWNIKRKEMAQYPIFWGTGLKQERCICYAPSINDAPIAEFKKYNYIKDALEKIYLLSTRDAYSKKVLEELSNRKIEELDDPTILLEQEFYKKIESKKMFDNYIFVYIAPQKINKEEIKTIVDYAKKSNKKIISYNIYHQWCDEVVYGYPEDFLSLIHNADCVFTSTFHGTMFSIIYNKKFIVFGENNKVIEVLRKLNIKNQFTNNYNESIDKILQKNFHYDKVNKYIEKSRKKSVDYLKENINLLEQKQS